MFDFERRRDEEGEPPSRSILGLEAVPTSPFAFVRAATGQDEEPPNASILGLAGTRASEVPLLQTRPRPGDEPPTRSFLGLEGIRPTRVSSSGFEPGANGEPPNESILGLGGIRPLVVRPDPAAPLPRQPAGGLFFGKEGIQADLFPAPPRPPREARPAEIQVPEFESEVQYKPRGAFPVERAILFSLAAHILLLVFLLSAPFSYVPDARKGLLAAFVPPEKSAEEKIPVIFREFRESPGPARPNPKPSALSDKTRRAGGGEASKQRSQTPFIPERPGIQGLEPGARKAVQPSRPALGESGEKQALAAPGQKAQGGPEAFQILPPGPNSTRRGELSGLDSAVEEAAKATVQGEAGAGFANPEGGRVDTGDLSFETTWYPWGEYWEALLRRLRLHWQGASDPFKGWVIFQWAILPDGRVADIQKIDTSGNPAYDFAALQAITGSNPFAPLPKDLLDKVGHDHREHVRVAFTYNYQRSEWERFRESRK